MNNLIKILENGTKEEFKNFLESSGEYSKEDILDLYDYFHGKNRFRYSTKVIEIKNNEPDKEYYPTIIWNL